MKKPYSNIIFICADQWRGDCLGFYKNQHPVMTPHLNQLAREGSNYTAAYAGCPICMPQRMTMLTGRSGSSLGVLTNFQR
jgi:arylsulfatase A-like enzyme